MCVIMIHVHAHVHQHVVCTVRLHHDGQCTVVYVYKEQFAKCFVANYAKV